VVSAMSIMYVRCESVLGHTCNSLTCGYLIPGIRKVSKAAGHSHGGSSPSRTRGYVHAESPRIGPNLPSVSNGDERDNPTRKVDKPRRLPSTRRAAADTRLAEINQVAARTGRRRAPPRSRKGTRSRGRGQGRARSARLRALAHLAASRNIGYSYHASVCREQPRQPQ
jgi:hypothetical protein